LAVSRHAPDDETRSRLTPDNSKYGVEKLVEACVRYFNKTGRRITFEYAMINCVNDSAEQAKKLSRLLHGTASHLNLILLSNVQEYEFKESTSESVDIFTDILKKNGVNYTVRRRLGTDIEAACGQLRNRVLKKERQSSQQLFSARS